MKKDTYSAIPDNQRIVAPASSGLLLNSQGVRPGLDLLLTCAFGPEGGLPHPHRVVYDGSCWSRTLPETQSVVRQRVMSAPVVKRLLCLALQTQTTALSSISWGFLHSVSFPIPFCAPLIRVPARPAAVRQVIKPWLVCSNRCLAGPTLTCWRSLCLATCSGLSSPSFSSRAPHVSASSAWVTWWPASISCSLVVNCCWNRSKRSCTTGTSWSPTTSL